MLCFYARKVATGELEIMFTNMKDCRDVLLSQKLGGEELIYKEIFKLQM